MDELAERAQNWLTGTYGGLVTLDSREPIVASPRTALFGCQYAGPQEPMLAATLCVPRDGTEPFPVSNAAPLDERLNLSGRPGERAWRWRVNARNCLVATDAAIRHHRASALPWHPVDERPGWWERLLARHFPGAEVATCTTWGEAGQAISDGGSGTRGVVWLQRALHERVLTGHLVYADWTDDGVTFVDGQQGSLARLDDREVSRLVVARFRRDEALDAEVLTVPWEVPAVGYPDAIEKAESWLEYTYDGQVELVSPDPDDELDRGWLFACTTRDFLDSGDWRDQMLDAAVVVPKSADAPFGLPNRDPWSWLTNWDEGKSVAPPPSPGKAAWFEPTMTQIGTVAGVRAHAHWAGVLDEMTSSPAGTQALVWVRRKDSRGRETVGHAVWAISEAGGAVQIVDPMSDDGSPLIDPAPFELRVIQVA